MFSFNFELDDADDEQQQASDVTGNSSTTAAVSSNEGHAHFAEVPLEQLVRSPHLSVFVCSTVLMVLSMQKV